MQENKMDTMPINKLVFQISIPLMISMLVSSIYNIVDSIFVAMLNEKALTATSIAFSAQIMQIAFGVGLAVGMNALVSKYLGAKQYDKANHYATTAFLLTILTSIIFIIWGFFSYNFLTLFTSNQDILEEATKYLRICLYFSPGIFIATYYQRLLQSTGRTVASMFSQIAGGLVNLILDPIFIFGIGFIPSMGISGAAIATVIGQWVAGGLGYYLNRIQNHEVKIDFKHFYLDRVAIIELYKIGLPTILTQAIGSIMLSCMNILLKANPSATAFFGIFFKLSNFVYMPINGLGQGSLPIIAYNYGSHNQNRMKDTMKLVLQTAGILGIISTIIFYIFSKELLILFHASNYLLGIGIPALKILSITFIFANMTIVIGYFIAALGNGLVNMIATFLRQLILLFPILLLFETIHLSIWYSFILSEALAFLYAMIRLNQFKMKMNIK